MSRELDAYWGATLDEVSFDARHQVATFRLRATGSIAELTMLGVTELRFFNRTGAPWASAEMTEIWLFPLPGERVRLEIELWSEESGLVAEADVIVLNGRPLEGRQR